MLMARDLMRAFDPTTLMRDVGLIPDGWQSQLLIKRPKRCLYVVLAPIGQDRDRRRPRRMDCTLRARIVVTDRQSITTSERRGVPSLDAPALDAEGRASAGG